MRTDVADTTGTPVAAITTGAFCSAIAVAVFTFTFLASWRRRATWSFFPEYFFLALPVVALSRVSCSLSW